MSIRPVFRVASAGLDPRDVRLIGIVFQHSQYNKYDFRMLDGLDLAGTDILIANPIDRAGLDAIASLAGSGRRIPSVSAVPRGAQATARYSVTIDRLTLQLLPTLNRVVETEMLEPADAAVAQAPDPAPAQAPAASGVDAAAAVAAELQPALVLAEASVADTPALAAFPVLHPPPVGMPGPDRATWAPPPSGPGGLPLATGAAVLAGGGEALTHAACAAAANAADAAANAAAANAAASAAADFAAANSAAVNAIAVAARRDGADIRHLPALQGQAHWHGQAQQAPARARLQVLVADPSLAAQQQLVRALSRMGLEVSCVGGVAAAMQRIAERYTDLVVTESGLSDGDGFELIRRLRAQPAYRYTPVLLLRSRLQVMDATRARLAGEVTVLAKPLSRQALEALVRQALRKSVILDDLSELLSPG